MNVRKISDAELLHGTQRVLGSRRRLTAQLLVCLGEIEARSLFLKEAHPSMYDYCVAGLSMSEGEAHRTLAAARVVRRFPEALPMVEDGRLHCSGLELLRTHLKATNHRALLEASCGKTKRQIEELIRAHFPRPDVPSRIVPVLEAPEEGGASQADPRCGEIADSHGAARAESHGAARAESPAAARAGAMASRASTRLRPLSATRFHLQCTVSREFRDKLARVQDLMRHGNPRGELEPIFERALDLLVADLEKTRLAKTDRPRRAKQAKHGAISRAARRKVFERDGERCTYVAPSGRRCTARGFIQLDHDVARARGGSGAPENLRVRCGAHNRFAAKQLFGEQYVDDKIAARRAQRYAGDCHAHTAERRDAHAAELRAAHTAERRDAHAAELNAAHTAESGATRAAADDDEAWEQSDLAEGGAPGRTDSFESKRPAGDAGVAAAMSARTADEPVSGRAPTAPGAEDDNDLCRLTAIGHPDGTAPTPGACGPVGSAPTPGACEAVGSAPTPGARSDNLCQRRSIATGSTESACTRLIGEDTQAKLVLGLKKMGFRERVARRAVAELAAGYMSDNYVSERSELSLPTLFRAALALLVP